MTSGIFRPPCKMFCNHWNKQIIFKEKLSLKIIYIKWLRGACSLRISMKKYLCWINYFVVVSDILSCFKAIVKLPWDNLMTCAVTLPVPCWLLNIGSSSGLHNVKDCVCNTFTFVEVAWSRAVLGAAGNKLCQCVKQKWTFLWWWSL